MKVGRIKYVLIKYGCYFLLFFFLKRTIYNVRGHMCTRKKSRFSDGFIAYWMRYYIGFVMKLIMFAGHGPNTKQSFVLERGVNCIYENLYIGESEQRPRKRGGIYMG